MAGIPYLRCIMGTGTCIFWWWQHIATIQTSPSPLIHITSHATSVPHIWVIITIPSPWLDQNYWTVNMPPTNEITSDELPHLLIDPDTLYLVARNFASHPTSTATLRHYHFLSLSIDWLKLDLERHCLEQQAISSYIIESRTFRMKIQPIVDEYWRKACLHRDRQSSYPSTLPSFNNHIHSPPTADDIPQETAPYEFSCSSCSSSTSHQAGIDEEIKMLGRMTNIVFDGEGMEGSKLIIVYNSNNELEDSNGLIRNDKDVCARCNQQQEDCGTPMRSFQHCPICAWTKQASCTHVDVSPVSKRVSKVSPELQSFRGRLYKRMWLQL